MQKLFCNIFVFNKTYLSLQKYNYSVIYFKWKRIILHEQSMNIWINIFTVSLSIYSLGGTLAVRSYVRTRRFGDKSISRDL